MLTGRLGEFSKLMAWVLPSILAWVFVETNWAKESSWCENVLKGQRKRSWYILCPSLCRVPRDSGSVGRDAWTSIQSSSRWLGNHSEGNDIRHPVKLKFKFGFFFFFKPYLIVDSYTIEGHVDSVGGADKLFVVDKLFSLILHIGHTCRDVALGRAARQADSEP